MRLAALDLGSNSFHLLVAEAHADGSFSVLAREKEMLRLGDEVARTGSLSPAKIAESVATVARFAAVADAYSVREVVALGTAALREATNGAELVERLEEETGVRVVVVDGVREAELVFLAVRASVALDPSPVLAADLGGGSLELAVGDAAGAWLATSLPIGVGRLTVECVRHDPPAPADRRRVAARVDAALDAVAGEVASLGPRLFVGTSGTFCTLARMAAARRDGEVPGLVNQLRVSRAELRAVTEELWRLPADARARLPGLDARRVELVPAGSVVLERLMARFGFEELTVSEWALREGIVLEAIGAHERAELAEDPRSLRRASVLSLCRRSRWGEPHARQVARLCATLFDALAHELGLEEADRELLELAALVHDVGEHVSREGHDRHGAYLVENAGLRGFSPEEVRILSTVVRYHVRGTPRPSFGAFRLLGAPARRRALRLVALLRLADALDASHRGVVERLEVVAGGRGVELRLAARGGAELERWMLRRKARLAEELLGRPVLGVLAATLAADVGRSAVGAAGLG